MKDEDKTKNQLIEELQQQILKLEKLETNHKYPPKMLQEISDRLEHLIASAPVALYTAKASGDYGVTFVSFNIKQIMGYESHEFIDNPSFWIDHVHPEDKKRILNEVTRIFEQKAYTYEYRFLHKDSTYKWIRDEMKLIEDEFGNPVEIVGYWIDTTDFKKAKETVKESEEKFRIFMESASDLMCITDADGNFTYVNKAMVKTLKYTKEEMIGMNVAQIISKESYENNTISKVKEELIKIGAIAIEDTWITKYEQKIYGELKFVSFFDSDGKFKGVRVVFRDITERKKAEDALRKSEEKFRIFMESASALMHIVDKDGNFIYVNEAMVKTLGYTKEELIGMNITQILHKEYLVKFFNTENGYKKGSRREELIAKGQINLETIWVTKDGKEIYCEVKVVALYDNDGNFLGNSAVVHDITERKKMEQELEGRASSLEGANTALRVLLKRREEDKTDLEEKVLLLNVKELVLLYLEKMKDNRLNKEQNIYVSILESDLNGIISPFSRMMSSKYPKLSLKEIQVANLIKKDKNSKEIGALLNVSKRTIDAHRDGIRKKIGIKNKKVNLKTYLLSIK
jgi:PAS domain S-box-containing protein